MTLPNSGSLGLGGPASNSINNEYGYGANLNAYRSKLYTNSTGTTISAFPSQYNPITMPTNFWGTRKIPSGSATYNPGTTSIGIPPYNSLTVNVYGPGGGASGSDGYYNCGSYTNNILGGGGSGGSGPTYFGTGSPGYATLTAYAGGGAPRGSPGSNAPGTLWPSGGTGGGSPGGNGSTTGITYTNPLIGGGNVGPTTGTSVPVSIGTGGPGGGGGAQIYILPVFNTPTCSAWNNAGSGGGGSNGYISVSWS